MFLQVLPVALVCAGLPCWACSETEGAGAGPDSDWSEAGGSSAAADASDSMSAAVDEAAVVDAAGSTDTPAFDDRDAPVVLSVRVDAMGALPRSVSLSSADARWVLCDPSLLRIDVLAHDDTTPAERLVVDIVDSSGDRVEAAASFQSGIWSLEVEASAGSVLRARVHDEAGNSVEHAYELQLPPLQEAMLGSWERRLYDTAQSVTGRRSDVFASPDLWTQVEVGGGVEVSGTFSFDGLVLSLAERTRSGGVGAEDTDAATIEQLWVREAYLDAVYLSLAPWRPAGGVLDAGAGDAGPADAGPADAATFVPAGLVGTWERQYELWQPEGSDVALVEAVTETLVLEADGRWWHERRGDAFVAGVSAPILDTADGTLRVQPAGGYGEALGDFLIFETLRRDGVPVAPVERVQLYVLRAGRLLLDPSVRP